MEEIAAVPTEAPTPGLDFGGTGRRKTSVARVIIKPGQGHIFVNHKPLEEYFASKIYVQQVRTPLEVTSNTNKFDVHCQVKGGGNTGQAGALVHGLARALVKVDADLRAPLSKAGLLTRDSRMVERKKYGQSGARKRYQFSKR